MPAPMSAWSYSRTARSGVWPGHYLALLDPERAQNFNIIAYEALMWCRQHIRPEFLEFLQGLPLLRKLPKSFRPATAPPATPTPTSLTTSRANASSPSCSNTLICGCASSATPIGGLCGTGISGVRSPCARSPRRPRSYPRRNTISSTPAASASPGTKPRAAYAIFDDEAATIEFKSVPYDVSGAQRRILAAGLPPYLAERLALGP